KNRDNSFYWCYKYKDSHNCKVRAVTILEGQSHVLKKFSKHNHAPEPSHADVIQALNNMREIVSQSRERPSQIIYDITINMPEDSFYYMPNNEALRKQISSLQEIDVPNQLQVTMRGEQFLAREINLNNEKIMIFCTSNNLLYFEEANYWLIDGIFKTVPTLFRQLYTIHAPVGGETNFCVFPLVYILMTNQLEESYKQVFQELLNLSKEASYNLNPPVIITYFEQSVINAVQIKFPNSVHKGCFFYMCQNFWRKIQVEGLAIEYGNNKSFSFRLCHLVALAFLPYLEILAAFDIIKPLMPSNTIEISNIVEKAHLGTYTIIEEIRKEQQQVDMQIEHVLHGKLRPTQHKYLVDHKKRIILVFNNHDTYTVVDFLRGITHNIS
ncbi:6617_t:CDS:2, partial [Dentiscutata erythropus]